jgi:hypothetical protein
VAGRVVPMTFGGVEVLVETVPVAGSEPTSAAEGAGEKVLDAFDKAREVIVGAAVSTVRVIEGLGAKAARPDRFEVEFGLGFSVKGNVIVAGASADATLKVKLSYDSHTVATG